MPTLSQELGLQFHAYNGVVRALRVMGPSPAKLGAEGLQEMGTGSLGSNQLSPFGPNELVVVP